jgi:hypothetical protein
MSSQIEKTSPLSTQFSQQFGRAVNDLSPLTYFEFKPIEALPVSRRIRGFSTSVADFAASRSMVFFLVPSSLCSPSQSSPQLRFDDDRRQISGIRAGLARACRPTAFFPAPLLTARFSLPLRNFAIKMKSGLRW